MNMFDEKYLQLTKEITVAIGDTDFNRRLKPSAIMGYCQDIAAEHAELLGFGYKELLKRNLTWVMIRMSFKILRTPTIGEILTIITLPEPPKTLDVNRGYYIYDAKGELVITASSKWCVIDIDTHKINRLAPVLEKYLESDYAPFQPLDDANPKILSRAEPDGQKPPTVFTVQVTDLDQNLHMNNTRYGDIILNACGMEMLKDHAISRVDLNFVSQLFVDDEYEVHRIHKDNISFIEARKPDSDIVVFRALTEWQQRSATE